MFDEVAYDQTADLTFHNVDYILHAFAQNSTLIIEAEQKSNGQRWKGEYPTRYIEEMTHKTGNFKKFSVFAKMLSTALSHKSESVFIDLLTYADLEMLKHRKTGKATAQTTSSKALQHNKRYLILTYVVEFDRVHYPLPLKFEANPDPASLKRTIDRLRNELEVARSVGDPTSFRVDLLRLQEENRKLRNALQENGGGDERVQQLEEENQLLRARIATLEADKGRGEGSTADKIVELEQEVDTLAEAVNQEKAINRRLVSKQRKDQRMLVEELEKRAESERAYRLTCRKLRTELEKMKKQAENYIGGGTPPKRQGRSRTRSISRERLLTRSRSGSTSSLRNGRSSRPSSATRLRASGPVASRSPAHSPAHSRSQSRSNSRSSSPARPRFDPSAYVREMEEKKRQRAKAAEKARRDKILNGSDSDSSLRGDRSRPRSAAARSRSPSPSMPSKQRESSLTRRTKSARSAASLKSPGRSPPLSRSTRSLSRERPDRKPSRGKAVDADDVSLQSSRRRADSRDRGASGNSSGRRSARSRPESDDEVEDTDALNASREISDINDRINALQYFLRAAKAGAS